MIKDICEFYPQESDDPVCACGSDISGKFVCTKEYSNSCQWANERREKKMFTFRDFYISERMMGGIKRYVEDGLRPGRFLTAVIENNLSNACGFADDENMSNLPAYAAYFYNEVPANCWGSKEKMNDWITQKGGKNNGDNNA